MVGDDPIGDERKQYFVPVVLGSRQVPFEGVSVDGDGRCITGWQSSKAAAYRWAVGCG